MKTKIILFLLGLGTGINMTLCTQKALKPMATWATGVFSTMEYIEEAGDLGGAEIYIFIGGGGPWVLYQEAAGEPMTPYLVKADITEDNHVSFRVPDDDGGTILYTGRITPKALYLKNSADERQEVYVMPRKKGYWE